MKSHYTFHSKIPMLCPLLRRASCLTLEINGFGCYEAKIEDCEGWWSSGCHGSVAEHWRLKPEVSWVRLLPTASFFHFPLFSPHEIQIHLFPLILCELIFITKVFTSVIISLYARKMKQLVQVMCILYLPPSIKCA